MQFRTQVGHLNRHGKQYTGHYNVSLHNRVDNLSWEVSAYALVKMRAYSSLC